MIGESNGNGPALSYRPAEQPLGVTWRGIRRGWWLVVLTTVLAVAAAVWWSSEHPREYKSEALILVNPIAVDDQTFLGVQTLRAGGEASRTLQTAVGLIRTEEAAQRTADKLGAGWDSDKVLDHVAVQGKGQSNLLAVTGRSGDPEEAARIATEFTRQSLAIRRAALRGQLDASIERLERQVDNLRGQRAEDEFAADLRRRLDTLEVAREVGDPTLSIAAVATPPDNPSGTPTAILAFVAALAGLLLGLIAALLRDLLDRRVRDEQELFALYPMPVLARIPSPKRRAGATPDPRPYRGLAGELIDAGDDARTVLVTSAMENDGKGTAAVGLSLALAEAGHSVLLVDLDPRERGVAHVLGVPQGFGPDPSPTPQSERLRVASPEPSSLEEMRAAVTGLVAEVHDSVDYVIIDAPALGEHGEALWITQHVQKVLIVARPRRTSRASYVELRERLERTGYRPAGVLVVGSRGGGGGSTTSAPYEYRQPALR